MSARIAGVDGCRRGWVLATGDHLEVVATFEEIADRGFDLIGVDMPFGLPDRGDRVCDREARRALGTRGSTVFPAPIRPVLDCESYEEALACSRAVNGKGLSKQAWNLVPKMREVDAAARRLPAGAVVEIHPELAFSAMTGAPLRSKHTPEGLAERRAALTAVGRRTPDTLPGAKADDIVDAAAVAWSAARVARGEARRWGDESVDRHGLPMLVYA